MAPSPSVTAQRVRPLTVPSLHDIEARLTSKRKPLRTPSAWSYFYRRTSTSNVARERTKDTQLLPKIFEEGFKRHPEGWRRCLLIRKA
jgi:hypothetical protein